MTADIADSVANSPGVGGSKVVGGGSDTRPVIGNKTHSQAQGRSNNRAHTQLHPLAYLSNEKSCDPYKSQSRLAFFHIMQLISLDFQE